MLTAFANDHNSVASTGQVGECLQAAVALIAAVLLCNSGPGCSVAFACLHLWQKVVIMTKPCAFSKAVAVRLAPRPQCRRWQAGFQTLSPLR